MEKFAFGTLEFQQGKFVLAKKFVSHGIEEKGVEWDKKNKVIKVTLTEKPSGHPGVVLAGAKAVPIEGSDYNEIRILCKEDPGEKTCLNFLAVYV